MAVSLFDRYTVSKLWQPAKASFLITRTLSGIVTVRMSSRPANSLSCITRRRCGTINSVELFSTAVSCLLDFMELNDCGRLSTNLIVQGRCFFNLKVKKLTNKAPTLFYMSETSGLTECPSLSSLPLEGAITFLFVLLQRRVADITSRCQGKLHRFEVVVFQQGSEYSGDYV